MRRSRRCRSPQLQAPNRADAEATEALVLAAWRKWYEEALDSVLRLPVPGPTQSLAARIERARGAIR